jgi:hypothetical protein
MKRTKGKDQAPPEKAPKPEPSEKERGAIEEAGARMKSRRNRFAIAVDTVDANKISITTPHADHAGWCARLADALGTSSEDFARAELARVMAALGLQKGDAETRQAMTNAALAAIDGQRPNNEMEALLLSQMFVTHAMAMDLLARVGRAEYRWQVQEYGTLATKLQRTYVSQCEAFAKMRRGGQQKVRVEHVHVYPGGQAVVGNVVTGGGGRQEDVERAHEVAESGAITYAPGETLWCPDPERAPVPANTNGKG